MFILSRFPGRCLMFLSLSLYVCICEDHFHTKQFFQPLDRGTYLYTGPCGPNPCLHGLCSQFGTSYIWLGYSGWAVSTCSYKNVQCFILTVRFVPTSYLISGVVTRVIRRVSHVEQELLILPGHLSSPHDCHGVVLHFVYFNVT